MKFELGLDKPDSARARTSAVTIAGAYIVGYVKGTFTGKRPFRSAWQTAVVGGLAAAAAFAVAKLIA
jgi:VIT1/CCC1 family predicted Fe2+/Mn2+ transporter